MNLSENEIRILIAIISAIVGAGIALSIKIIIKKNKNSGSVDIKGGNTGDVAGRDMDKSNRVVQKGNKVGGDMAGGDINK